MIQPLEHASRYFSEQGIPFPKTVLNEEEKTNLKECYIFEDAATPGAPIVLYFPLVNDSFQRFVAPGKLSISSHVIKVRMPSLSIPETVDVFCANKHFFHLGPICT